MTPSDSSDAERLRRTTEALRESERRFEVMADAAPLMIWLHDAEGRQEYVNQTFCDYFGVRREEMRDERWKALVHPEDAPGYVREFLACVAERRPFHAEVRVRRHDGEWRWLECWAQPRLGPGGEYLGHVGTSADVTERKQGEEALRRSRDELERRVEERTRELRHRADQLARLSSQLTLVEHRERRRLVRILHDHVQQLLVAAQLALGGDGTAAEPALDAARRHLAEAIQATRSLAVELHPPVLHERGLSAGIEWMARRLEQTHRLSVDLSLDPAADPEREDVRTLVYESVRELLLNVVKHAGVDRAEVRLAREGDAMLAVTVNDHGQGFDPAQVLGPAARSDAGFGLFSIRERLALLGGRLDVESIPGDGARFTVTAPRGR